jgi:hypothetical protein
VFQEMGIKLAALLTMAKHPLFSQPSGRAAKNDFTSDPVPMAMYSVDDRLSAKHLISAESLSAVVTEPAPSSRSKGLCMQAESDSASALRLYY